MHMEMQMERENPEKRPAPPEWQSNDKYTMRGGIQTGGFITAELADSGVRAVNNYDALIAAIEAEAARRAVAAGLGVSEWEAFLWPEARAALALVDGPQTKDNAI